MRATPMTEPSESDILWSTPKGMACTGLGRSGFMRLASDAEAIVRVGSRVLVSPEKLRKYVDRMAE